MLFLVKYIKLHLQCTELLKYVIVMVTILFSENYGN